MSKLKALAKSLPKLPERVLIGLSGGADSVALLHLLRLKGCRVHAVHVNHGLRGEASDGDEQFVRQLCRDMQIPLLVYRAEPPAHPSEDWARQARYGFFRQAMQETKAEALVLAHHRDDQSETVLLHLLRGSGLTGLCGMRADSEQDGVRILRPLLHLTRSQLRDALTEAGQTWREDASNADPRYLRNAVRTQVMPLLEQLSPGAIAHIAAAAELLQADEDALKHETDASLTSAAYYPLERLRPMAPGLRARVVRGWWSALGPDVVLSHAQTDALLRLIDGHAGQQCNLPLGWHGYRGWQCLHLLPPEAPSTEAAPVPMTDLGVYLDHYLLTIEPAYGPGDGKRCQAIPRAMLEGCVLRHRRIGDWIRPFGSAGKQSLQDYLVNRRVDAPFRDLLPLLCQGDEVLLVGGVGAGGIPPYQNDQDAVSLVWHGDMPWQNAEPKHPKGDHHHG